MESTKEPFNCDSDQLVNSAIEKKLALSVEERIESHENARKLIRDLSFAPKEMSAGPQKAS